MANVAICCPIRSRNCLPFTSIWMHARFFGGVRVAPEFTSGFLMGSVLLIFLPEFMPGLLVGSVLLIFLPEFMPGLLVGSVLLIFLVFCVVLLCVFMFWVPSCDVRYDFRIEMMFGSSLPPVVCRRAHVLFTLFVFVCV